MQSICEMVEASVKQLVLNNGTTLRVKLSVTPLTSRKGNRKGEDRTYLKQTKQIYILFDQSPEIIMI